MSAIGVIFAHQGGWDEILMVLGPLAILFVLLMLANKRARRLAESRATEDRATEDRAAQDRSVAAVDAGTDGPSEP